MPKFQVICTSHIYNAIEVEAENEAQAIEMAHEADGDEFSELQPSDEWQEIKATDITVLPSTIDEIQEYRGLKYVVIQSDEIDNSYNIEVWDDSGIYMDEDDGIHLFDFVGDSVESSGAIEAIKSTINTIVESQGGQNNASV